MSFKYKIVSLSLFLLSSFQLFCQRVNDTPENRYDPDRNKIIPDKVFEIGLPLLFLFLIVNMVVSIFKVKAENRLKEKAIDKGMSEASLVALFGEDQRLSKLVYLKWFLILAALGSSLLIVYSFASFFEAKSGYLALGTIMLFQAIAFLIYYRILKNR